MARSASSRSRSARVSRPPWPQSLQEKGRAITADVEARHALAQKNSDVLPYDQAGGPPTPAMSTPRESLARWYDKTEGGFDAAVESSQAALNKYGTETPYGDWPAENADRPVGMQMLDTRLGDASLELPSGGTATGIYDPALHSIGLNNQQREALRSHGVLDHEMTHALTMGHQHTQDFPMGALFAHGPFFRGENLSPLGISVVPDEYGLGDNVQLLRMLKGMGGIYGPEGWEKLGLRNEGWRGVQRSRSLKDAQYRASRVEMDPMIAEVRRRFAWNTGQDVRTPEDAARALDWFSSNRRELSSLPQDRPTMNRIGLELLTNPPGGEESRQRVLRRMTQVPGILAPLLGYSAEQEGQPPQYFEVR